MAGFKFGTIFLECASNSCQQNCWSCESGADGVGNVGEVGVEAGEDAAWSAAFENGLSLPLVRCVGEG